MTRILYFSRSYTPHDHRFLTALAGTPHTTAFLQLGRVQRRTEMRPVPKGSEVIPWLGGQKPFCWRDVPALTADLQRVIDSYQPDVIPAGTVQSAEYCAGKRV